MKAARTRIGRVRPKSGGEIVLLAQKPPEPVPASIRDWLDAAMSAPEGSPHAFVAVAFWNDPASPGGPSSLVGWATDHDAFPRRLLVRLAEETIRQRLPDLFDQAS